MRITEIKPEPDWMLSVKADNGRCGRFDVRPYPQYEAFVALCDREAFATVANGGYFVEWECGAYLSADTIEARWQIVGALPREIE